MLKTPHAPTLLVGHRLRGPASPRASTACRKGALLGALTLLGVGAIDRPARAETFSLDACDYSPDKPEVRALIQAGHDLGAHDDDKVRAAVAGVRKTAADDPFLLLWSGSLLSSLKDPGADAAFKEAIAAAKALPAKYGKTAEPVAQLYEATALLRLGKADAAGKLLQSVRARPDAYKTYACRFIPAAQALADTGHVTDGLALLRAVRKAAPKARSINDALIELALRTRDEKEVTEVFDGALSEFPNDLEFTVRKANWLKTSKGPDAALALLEPLLVKGESSPSLLGEYLGLVSAAPTEAQLEHYKALSTAHPDVQALTMMVGVVLHYLHRYQESSTYLEKTGNLIDKEPRVAMYLAMNYFHTPGKEQLAKDFVERAARAGRPDPDIYYCRAVVEVRDDPAGAVKDLQRYLSLTEGRSDVREEKQKRVRQTLELVSACVAGPDPKGCVEREVVEKAKALAFAEHFKKPGTNKDDDDDDARARTMSYGDAGAPSDAGGHGLAEALGSTPEAVKSTADRTLAIVAVALLAGMAFFIMRSRKK